LREQGQCLSELMLRICEVEQLVKQEVVKIFERFHDDEK
jgi:hypothetical protein